MNVERLHQVRDLLRKNEPPKGFDGFDMNHYRFDYGECGTKGCIAGWTVALFAPDIDIHEISEFDHEFFRTKAGELLGLNHQQQYELFEPGEFYGNFDNVTADKAADLIDRRITEWLRDAIETESGS